MTESGITPLSAALGLKDPCVVAITGSGGKTTLLHLLGRELSGLGHPVIITTTTHIYPPKAGHGAGLWILGNMTPAAGEVEQKARPGKVLTVAGGHTIDGKLRGISGRQAASLAATGVWVLAEADGSARLPLKAWAEWEPALPEGPMDLVVVAGARGLGRPLGRQWVHRPDLFARASGLQLGDTVDAQALARVLTGPDSPLHKASADKTALVINQADSASARDMADLAQALKAQGGGAGYGRLLSARLRWGRIAPL